MFDSDDEFVVDDDEPIKSEESVDEDIKVEEEGTFPLLPSFPPLLFSSLFASITLFIF